MTHKGGNCEDAVAHFCVWLTCSDSSSLFILDPFAFPDPRAFAVAPSPPSPRSAAQVTSLDLLLCFHAL